MISNAVRNWLELSCSTPPWHQQKETEVNESTYLTYGLGDITQNDVFAGTQAAPDAGRLDAEVTEHQEGDREHDVDVLVPARTIADRLDLRVIQPRQAAEDHDRHAHEHHTEELGIENRHAGDDRHTDHDRRDLEDRIAIGLHQQQCHVGGDTGHQV